jgi:hypothetical protein
LEVRNKKSRTLWRLDGICYNQEGLVENETLVFSLSQVGRFCLLSILSIKRRKELNLVEMDETGETVECVESSVFTRVSANPKQIKAGS